MKEKKIDLALNIVEGIVCVIGILIFSIACIEVKELQRFLFLIADVYCAFKLVNCLEGIVGYIKSKNSKYESKELDQVINLS